MTPQTSELGQKVAPIGWGLDPRNVSHFTCYKNIHCIAIQADKSKKTLLEHFFKKELHVFAVFQRGFCIS